MIDNKAAHFVEMAVKEELQKAIEEHGEFKNSHEAIAIMLEECQEAWEEAAKMERTAESNISGLWKLVRADAMEEKAAGKIEKIRTAVLKVAHECIQVAAMCDKWEMALKQKEIKYEDWIEEQPTAEVEQVRHGKWEWLGPNWLNKGCWCGTCSNCKKRSEYIVNRDICPNCGAKMDGDK